MQEINYEYEEQPLYDNYIVENFSDISTDEEDEDYKNSRNYDKSKNLKSHKNNIANMRIYIETRQKIIRDYINANPVEEDNPKMFNRIHNWRDMYLSSLIISGSAYDLPELDEKRDECIKLISWRKLFKEERNNSYELLYQILQSMEIAIDNDDLKTAVALKTKYCKIRILTDEVYGNIKHFIEKEQKAISDFKEYLTEKTKEITFPKWRYDILCDIINNVVVPINKKRKFDNISQ